MSANSLPVRRPDSVYQDETRPIFFIADLHLSQTLEHTVASLERFIKTTAGEAGALYILGDLFNAWVGDDLLTLPFMQSITTCLSTLAKRGIALYVMRGNRDFLLGERFASAAQAQLISDPWIMEAFGSRIVLTHGDTLCTADHAYQRFRKIVRCRAVQRLFTAIPLSWRLTLAARIRATSQNSAKRYQHAFATKWDVTSDAVSQLFNDTHATTMIHGHTHRPAKHLHGNHTRWVLPDWDFDHGAARGGYLRLDKDGIQMLPIT